MDYPRTPRAAIYILYEVSWMSESLNVWKPAGKRRRCKGLSYLQDPAWTLALANHGLLRRNAPESMPMNIILSPDLLLIRLEDQLTGVVLFCWCISRNILNQKGWNSKRLLCRIHWDLWVKPLKLQMMQFLGVIAVTRATSVSEWGKWMGSFYLEEGVVIIALHLHLHQEQWDFLGQSRSDIPPKGIIDSSVNDRGEGLLQGPGCKRCLDCTCWKACHPSASPERNNFNDYTTAEKQSCKFTFKGRSTDFRKETCQAVLAWH